MRDAFADEVTKLGREDERLVLLSGDIGNRMFDRFKEYAPSRFFNCGVAEANMMSVASGMALCGLRPIIYTITPFTTTRCLEQIRIDACYHRAPVVIVGTGAGLSYAELGPTHHSLEDLALLRSLPEMTVLAPCDQVELRLALRAALKLDGPAYMRIGKKGEPVVHEHRPAFQIGKAITIRSGSDICLISTGNLMPIALQAADLLAKAGLSARVESFHTIKPLDTEMLSELFRQFPLIVTIEEHSRLGGLGGSIAEWHSQQLGVNGHMLIIATEDCFMHEVGTQAYARQKFGLTPSSIADQAHSRLRALRSSIA